MEASVYGLHQHHLSPPQDRQVGFGVGDTSPSRDRNKKGEDKWHGTPRMPLYRAGGASADREAKQVTRNYRDQVTDESLPPVVVHCRPIQCKHCFASEVTINRKASLWREDGYRVNVRPHAELFLRPQSPPVTGLSL